MSVETSGISCTGKGRRERDLFRISCTGKSRRERETSLGISCTGNGRERERSHQGLVALVRVGERKLSSGLVALVKS